jgi:hypothetical protein
VKRANARRRKVRRGAFLRSLRLAGAATALTAQLGRESARRARRVPEKPISRKRYRAAKFFFGHKNVSRLMGCGFAGVAIQPVAALR